MGLRNRHVVVRNVERTDLDIVDQLAPVGTATVHEAIGRRGYLGPDITPIQQDAMLDWLHFGGQLVVSGPGSMDLLRGSFLDNYLPADTIEYVGVNGEDKVAVIQVSAGGTLYVAEAD